MIFPSNVFDILKWICIVAIPAFEVFYGTVGAKLGWPSVEQVVVLLAGIHTLLGSLLGVSHYQYYHQEGFTMPEDETEVDNNGEG